MSRWIPAVMLLLLHLWVKGIYLLLIRLVAFLAFRGLVLFKVCIFDKINLPSFSVEWPVSLEFCWAEILLDSVNLTMLPLLPVINGFSFCFVEWVTLNHKPGTSHDHFIVFFQWINTKWFLWIFFLILWSKFIHVTILIYISNSRYPSSNIHNKHSFSTAVLMIFSFCCSKVWTNCLFNLCVCSY